MMTIDDIRNLVRPNIRSLCPYSTARDDFKGSLGIFLDANESPYENGVNRYPDPHQKALKARISEIKGIDTGKIFLGNGSDEAIDLVFRVFCTPGVDNVVAISPSYGMYTVAAATNDVAVREVLLNEDFSLDTDRLLASCDSRTKAIFLCSPNNPSGNALGNAALEKVLSESRAMVIVDEAYIDFCSTPSLLPLIDRYPNLIILQTMSKARAMAGLRLGLAFSNEYVIGLMSMIKYPYNINVATQKTALEILSKDIRPQIEEIKAQRTRVAQALRAFGCVREIFPSDANFILVRVDDADRLYGHLTKDGIIVRNRTRQPLCKDCLRLTIGLPQENDSMLESIASYDKQYK